MCLEGITNVSCPFMNTWWNSYLSFYKYLCEPHWEKVSSVCSWIQHYKLWHRISADQIQLLYSAFVSVCLPSMSLWQTQRQQPFGVSGLFSHCANATTQATPGPLRAPSQASMRSGMARMGQGTKDQLLAEYWPSMEARGVYSVHWMHVIHLFIAGLCQMANRRWKW